jgi:hypothetical protein
MAPDDGLVPRNLDGGGRMTGTLVLPSWLPSFEERRRKDEALARQYGLIRIAGNAGYDLMRCGRCRGKHAYLTLMCEPQPFDGATRGVYAWFHALGLAGAELHMTPAERQRFANLRRMLNLGRQDFASAHPRTARQFGTAENDADVGAIPLGLWEPIAPTLAQRLLDRVNAKGPKPPLVVPGLITNGRLGVLAPSAGQGGQHAQVSRP